MGAEFQRDILPGEILTFDCDGIHSDTSHCGTAPRKMCIFEYIYFARPDSVIDGVSVQHEELLACYPECWVQLVKDIMEGKQ